MSLERAGPEAFGAESCSRPATGMNGAIAKARKSQEHRNSFMPQPIQEPANPETHADPTAEEIWADSEGKVES